ncbi:MAG: hypothetical protein KQH53_08265 [Desulfarculaceae bacterium]|nr:hypothetical protein [Desulfarculaceae bacterium]
MAGLLDNYTRFPSTPGPQPAQRPSLAPPSRPSGGLIKAPEASPFWHGYRSTVWGPVAAELQLQRERAPYRQKVAARLGQELMEGRPQNRPISEAELVGALQEISPEMLGDAQGMKQLHAWIGMWNKEAAAMAKSRADNWDRQAGVAKNLFDSGKELGAGLNDQQRQFLGRFGYASRDQAGLASAPGAGLVPYSAPLTPPVTTVKRDGKERVFTGYLPGAAQREAEKIRATTPATAAKAGAVEGAKEKSAFPWFMKKEQWKLDNPDPRQQDKDHLANVKRLTQLHQLRLKVGQYGTDNPEMAAVLAGMGFKFNPEDPQAKEQALQAMDREIAILNSKLPADWRLESQQPPAMAPQTSRPPSSKSPMLQMKQPPQGGKSPYSKYPDAKQGPDGNWYVVRDGRKYKVVAD